MIGPTPGPAAAALSCASRHADIHRRWNFGRRAYIDGCANCPIPSAHRVPGSGDGRNSNVRHQMVGLRGDLLGAVGALPGSTGPLLFPISRGMVAAQALEMPLARGSGAAKHPSGTVLAPCWHCQGGECGAGAMKRSLDLSAGRTVDILSNPRLTPCRRLDIMSMCE